MFIFSNQKVTLENFNFFSVRFNKKLCYKFFTFFQIKQLNMGNVTQSQMYAMFGGHFGGHFEYRIYFFFFKKLFIYLNIYVNVVSFS